MKNVALALLTLTLLVAGCKKKPAAIVIVPDVEKNHLQRNHNFGEIKYLNTYSYFLQNDSLPAADTADIKKLLGSAAPDLTASQFYTSDGYLLRYVKLGKSHDTLIVRDYHYSSDAKISAWEEYDSTRTLLTSGKYIYDRNRFLSEEKVFKDDSLVMSFKYTTDGIGNIIAAVQSFGNFQTKTESKYDENGLVTQIVEYEPNGKVFKTAKIEYDNYGDEVNRCVYKAGDQMIEYTYNKYDKYGRIRQTIYEDRIHDVKEYHYFFDFDKQKNWRYEVCVVDNLIVYVKERKIIYYNEF